MLDFSDKFSDIAKRSIWSAIRDLDRMPRHPDTIGFGAGAPDPTTFPMGRLRPIFAAAFDDPDFRQDGLQYGPTEGTSKLAAQIAADMETLSVLSARSNILVTNGSQQGIHFVCEALLNPGDVVAVDNETYPGALQVFAARGARVLTLTDVLETGARCRLIYTVPTFQNPTGATYSRERRRELVALARKLDAIIIEDDPYRAVRYEGHHLPTIQSLDCEDRSIEDSRVVYLGTFSKSLFPGTRIGWMVGPSRLIEQATLLKQTEDLQPASLSQAILSRLLESDLADFREKALSIYRARRDAMSAALREHIADRAAWNEPEGGFFYWLTLARNIDTHALLPRGAEIGVTFIPGAAFSTRSTQHNTLRLSFSHAPVARFEEGIKRLAKAIDDSGAGPASLV